MHAIVTGCAGFIGSHLCERLVADGWRVTGIDAFTDYYDPREKRANLGGLTDSSRFDLVEADLNRAPLDRLFADQPAVFHLAAQPGVRASFGDGFARYLHDNVQATQRVFEAAADAGVRRVVYASSSSVYGEAASYPSAEGASTAPRSPYGVTKRTCEDLGRIARHRGVQTVGLRYFTVYGPRQRPDMAMRRICESAHGGPRFRLFGDGTQSRDFTFVDDAVDATVRAMVFADPGPLLNVGGGQEATMNQVIGIIEGYIGRSLDVERTSGQRGDVFRTCADTTLARRLLDWQPSVDLVTGLRAELEFVAARRLATVGVAA
ncbi:MAG: NAD-dependent epimerase/dehydratase family protein [Acidimicrobiales bacterium]